MATEETASQEHGVAENGATANGATYTGSGHVRERGRPEYYQDPANVQEYDRRFEGWFARWKDGRKRRMIAQAATPTAKSVLEVACGNGRWVGVVPGARHVAVDLSPVMLAACRERNPQTPVAVADAGALPFADRSFDVVVCTRFLAHLRGEFRARVLREFARIARQRVVIDGRHPYNLRFLSRWARRRLGMSHADKLRHGYDSYRTEFAAAGLSIVSFRSIAWGLSARVVIEAAPTSGQNEHRQNEPGA